MTRRLQLTRWYTEQYLAASGGTPPEPKHVALKMLEEVVELCIETGARIEHMHRVVNQKIASEKPNFDDLNMRESRKELVDTRICMLVLSKLLLMTEEEIEETTQAKFDAIREREWGIDSVDGRMVRKDRVR